MNGGRNLPVVITPCGHCNHPPHDMGVRCGTPISSTIREDVGQPTPSYTTRTMLVGTCGCTACGVWGADTYDKVHQWAVPTQVTTPASHTGHHPNAKGGAQLIYDGHLDDSFGAWLHGVYDQLVHAAHPPEPPRAICKHSGSTACGIWSRCEYPTCTTPDSDDDESNSLT